MDKALVAIVGGESLIGGELRDLLATDSLGVRAKLIGSDPDQETVLTAQGDEAVVMTALDEGNLVSARVVFLAGSAESGRKAFQILKKLRSTALVVDLTHTFEDHPEASLRAPLAEPQDFVAPPGSLAVIAHSAASALALFFRLLHARHPAERSVVQVFEPVSERGRAGVEELQRQTVSMLSFKPLPQKVFDAQICFNLLARYGSEAPQPLEAVEGRIGRHLATLLAGRIPMPSLRLLQAPVFHGIGFSIWVEFGEKVAVSSLGRALACKQVEVRGHDVEPPTVVGAVGQSGLTVGAIQADRSHPRAAWFWMVADNFRLAAENGLAVARPAILAGGAA